MASQNISFETIPSSLRKPGKYFEFNTKLAVRTLPTNLQKVLVVGARMNVAAVAVLSTFDGEFVPGEVEAGVLKDIFSDTEAALYFGSGSQLHLMCKAAMTANPFVSLQAIAVEDVTNALLADYARWYVPIPAIVRAGVIQFNIGGQVILFSVDPTMLLADIYAAFAAAAGAHPELPVMYAEGEAGIELIAKNAGTQGNQIVISATNTAGVTLVVSVLNLVAAGLVVIEPDIGGVLADIFAAGHDIVVSGQNGVVNLTTLRDHLDSVSGSVEQRGAIGVAAFTSALTDATQMMTTVNPKRISAAMLAVPQTPWELAAAYGAVIASEEDPARPLNTLVLKGISAPELAAQLSRTEQEVALYNGVTPLEVGPGGTVQIVRAITGYTVDANGIDDPSLLDLTTIRTLDYVRKASRSRMNLVFPRDKLSDRTPQKVRDQQLDVLYKLEELEIVEKVAANADGLICERDLQNPNQLNIKIPTDVVNGLHVLAARIDLIL